MLLPLLAAGWLLAFAVVGALHGPWWLGGAWLGLLVPLALLLRGRGAALAVSVAAILALAGGWRFADWRDRPIPALAALNGQEVRLAGVVDSEADPGRTTVRYRLRVERAALAREELRPVSGRVLLTLNQYTELLPGDRLAVSGELEAPEPLGDFDYPAYLFRQGVTGTMLFPRVERLPGHDSSAGRLAAAARRRLEHALQRTLPEPEASLAAGLAFGRDGNMPRELVADFRDAGLAHVVAVSGSNVAFIGAIAFWLATRFLRRTLAVLPAAALVTLYVVAAGPSASVTRAGIMAGIYLLGLLLGRPQAGLAALGAAAILMTALQPGTAVDAGFQLSLAATAGLITLGPWIRRGLDAMAEAARVPWLLPPAISEVASLTLSATAATLPITWVTFGRVSLISPLANVVAAPVVAVGFPAALLTAVAGALWEPAGWLLGLGAYYPLALLDWLASAFAGLPLAAIATPAAGNETAVVAAAALAAVGWLAYLRPPGEERPHAPPSPPAFRRLGLAAGMGGFAVAVLRTSLLPVSGGDELIVSFLDVGQGDAILVTTPGNHRTLVDGGPSGIDLARQLSSQLPHWERGLDRIILTHPQEDHVGGLPAALARYDVGEVLTNGARSGTQTMTLFAAHMGGRTLAAGDRWEEDGVRFEVLWPPAGYRADDPNDAGIVLRITFGRTSFLLTADIEAGPQQALLAAGLEPASVLKVPHHGSKTSEARFLQAAGARLAVIQVGAGNRFGHPAAETLAALAGSTILRTDLDGRITVRSDGRRLRFTTSR